MRMRRMELCDSDCLVVGCSKWTAGLSLCPFVV